MASQPADPELSDRGFKHMIPLPSEYGGTVRVYESSAAKGPHIWLRVECPADLNDPDGPKIEAVAHLTVENASNLADQIGYLVANHYQLSTPSVPEVNR